MNDIGQKLNVINRQSINIIDPFLFNIIDPFLFKYWNNHLLTNIVRGHKEYK
jgi:hypothetical protein